MRIVIICRKKENKVHTYGEQQHQKVYIKKRLLGIICPYRAKKANIEYKRSM